MAYIPTLTYFQQDVLSRLGESLNSFAADLRSGPVGATIPTFATLTDYLGESQEDVCRAGYPVTDTGTIASQAGRFAPFTSMATTTGNTLWAARSVEFAGAPLTYCSRSALETNVGPVGLEAAGLPQFWFPQGADGVGIYPVPATPGVLTVPGLALPPRLNNSSLNSSTIATATNANPIVCTTTTPHLLTSGRTIQINSAVGNTAANGTWVVTVTGPSTFSIPVAGNGVYTTLTGTVDDVATWLEPDLAKAIGFRAAWMVAEKNTQNPALAARSDIWKGEYEMVVQGLLARLWASDPFLAAAHFPKPEGA